MKKMLLAALIACLPSATFAQANLPQLTYGQVVNGVVVDPTPPSVVPADSEMPAAVAEFDDITGFAVADQAAADSVHVVDPNDGSAQIKARFTCSENGFVGYLDQIRLKGLQPAGHGHGPYFGSFATGVNDTSYDILRSKAQANRAAGVQSSTCPGDWINNSQYWKTWIEVPDAIGDGVTPGDGVKRIKRADYITLYYQGDPKLIGIYQYIRRGLTLLFGTNMDDPDMTAMQSRVAAFNAANPSVKINFPTPWNGGTKGGVRSYWNCAGSGTARGIGLTNPDGSLAFTCAAGQPINWIVTSNDCWNGHLTAVDGFSNTLPALRSDVDGKLHCPAEYPWRLPEVQQIATFSHRGPADYRRWRLSSDDMMATIVGRPVGNGESGHMDYRFGWLEKISNAWQCNIGIKVPGRTDCTTPRDMNFSTIGPIVQGGPAFRLYADQAVPTTNGRKLADASQRYTGAKLSDWINLPGIKPGAMPNHSVHVEVR